MAETAERSDPALWEAVKREITRSERGGRPGQWSARKAQIAVQEYKRRGGGYRGAKSADNSLVQWTEEEWGTKSGGESLKTGERYLPKAARAALSKDEYARTTAKKRRDIKAGKQFSAQPTDVAKKTAPYHHHAPDGETKAALMAEARARGIPGRSHMSKEELARALR